MIITQRSQRTQRNVKEKKGELLQLLFFFIFSFTLRSPRALRDDSLR